MTSTHKNVTIGMLGAGTLAQAIAIHALAAGHRVVLSSRRGPSPLGELTRLLGPGASAGTVAEAARADIVILAVPWNAVRDAVSAIDDWEGRIVIDATNQWATTSPMVPADLGDQTGSERNAALLPGARVVKAFNTLYGRITAQNPRHAEGRLVVFMAGDDDDAKAEVARFVESVGFAPVDIGDLRGGGRLMQVGGGPLSGLHVLRLDP
jgi:8-hydroxy-5-deazaflavin:NADPH oxidoreductase